MMDDRFRRPWLALFLMISLCLAACAAPGSAAPVVKIGVIAPFEGLGRPTGYAVLPAVKAAVAEANAAGALGAHRVAVVALNDDSDPEAAARQARRLAEDADVVAVLGPFDFVTAQAAAPPLGEAGLPALVAAPLESPRPGILSLCPAAEVINSVVSSSFRVAISLPAELSLSTFSNWEELGYAKSAPGGWIGGPNLAQPGFIALAGASAEGSRAVMCDLPALAGWPGQGDDAVLAQQAALAEAGARFVLQALRQEIAESGRPTREGVGAALAAQPIKPTLTWIEVVDGRWVRSSEP